MSGASLSIITAQTCFRDGLSCVFAFLSLRELQSVICTCQSWLDAVRRSPPFSHTLHIDRNTALESLPQSALRQHIATIIPAHSVDFVLHIKRYLDTVALLPALTHLHAVLNTQFLIPFNHHSTFSPTLRALHLGIYNQQEDDQMLNAILATLPSNSPDLGYIQFTVYLPAQINFEHLARLPNLRVLILQLRSVSDTQIEALKQLTHLEYFKLNAGMWDLEHLAAFCRPPHFLNRLKYLVLDMTILDEEEVLPSLKFLPSLRMLQPKFSTNAIELFEQLHQLKHLESARLRKQLRNQPWQHLELFRTVQPRGTVFYPHESLKELFLRQTAVIHSSDMNNFLASLVRLETLALHDVYLESIDFLMAMPQLNTLALDLTVLMNESVERLHFDDEPIEFAEEASSSSSSSTAISTVRRTNTFSSSVSSRSDEYFSILRACTSLTSLTIRSLGSVRLTTAQLNALQIPSSAMPQLKVFRDFRKAQMTLSMPVWRIPTEVEFLRMPPAV